MTHGSLSNVKSTLQNPFNGRIRNNDILLIYIVSHGEGFLSDTGKYPDGEYLKDILPSHYDQANDEAINNLFEHYNGISWFNVDESILLNKYDSSNNVISGSYACYFDDDVKSDISNIPCQRMIFMWHGCKSGGFIDDLSLSQENKKRIIITATSETTSSYRRGYVQGNLEKDAGYTEFSREFMSAINGHCPSDEQLFPDPPLNIDNLGYFSLKDAFDYAKAHDNKDETPWLDDDGDRYPTYINNQNVMDPENNDGNIAKITYFGNGIGWG